MLVGGCQNDDSVENQPLQDKFLSLPDDVNFSSLSEEEELILNMALKRVEFKEDEDGFFYLYPETAQEANISEELYCRFKTMTERYNSGLLNEELKTRSVFNSNGENDSNDDYYYPTDCFAHAIAGALPNVSYVEANYIYVQIFGNKGVPCKSIPTALSWWGSYHVVDFQYQGSLTKAIGIISNDAGGGHAINILEICGDSVHYYDNQAAFYHFDKVDGYCSRYSCQIYQYD